DGNDIAIGDAGFIDYVMADSDASDIDKIATSDAPIGGADTITTGAGNDFILGGAAGDTINAGAGNDLVFGDYGSIQGNVDANQLPLAMPVALKPFTFNSTSTAIADGGGQDVMHGNGGGDILIGGQDNDTIYGDDGDDDIIGGHTVAGGTDAQDILDGGAGN